MDIDSVLKLIYSAKEMLKGYQLTTSDGKVYTIPNTEVKNTSTTWKGIPPVVTEVILPDKTKLPVGTIVNAKLV